MLHYQPQAKSCVILVQILHKVRRATLRETSSWTLQASASTSNVNVHHSTVYGSFKRFEVKASSL